MKYTYTILYYTYSHAIIILCCKCLMEFCSSLYFVMYRHICVCYIRCICTTVSYTSIIFSVVFVLPLVIIKYQKATGIESALEFWTPVKLIDDSDIKTDRSFVWLIIIIFYMYVLNAFDVLFLVTLLNVANLHWKS